MLPTPISLRISYLPPTTSPARKGIVKASCDVVFGAWPAIVHLGDGVKWMRTGPAPTLRSPTSIPQWAEFDTLGDVFHKVSPTAWKCSRVDYVPFVNFPRIAKVLDARSAILGQVFRRGLLIFP